MSFSGMSRSIIRCAVFCSGDDSSFGFAPGTHRLMSLRPAIPWRGALLHCPPPLYQPMSILNRLVGTVNHHLMRTGEFSTGDMGNFQPELTLHDPQCRAHASLCKPNSRKRHQQPWSSGWECLGTRLSGGWGIPLDAGSNERHPRKPAAEGSRESGGRRPLF